MTTQTPDPIHLAERHLLAPYQLGGAELDRVFGALYRHDLDYADLYFQYHRGEAWSLEEGIVKAGSFNIEQGVGVRAISGEKTAFAYSDDIGVPALLSAAEATRWPLRPRSVSARACRVDQRTPSKMRGTAGKRFSPISQ